jgi:hypothetical protein
MRAQEFISEISDERLQDYLSRAGHKVDRRMTRMAQARDRLNKGYEIYHAETPNKVVDRFEAHTPALAQRYYNDFISKYESDVDYDLRLRRATGIVESVDAYHGTFQSTLSKFNSLSHFGTLRAAEDRIKAKARKEKIKTPGRIYQVTLDIKNPFVVKDFAGVHSPTHFAFDLKNQGLISQEEMLAITELAGKPGQVPALIKKLRELGFDGIAYKNKYEDKGSTSYVILDPAQVISVKPVTANKPVSEAFDQPYPIKWEKSEHGDYDALATLGDGTYLSIMFNNEGDDEYQIEFHRNNSQAITGEGDAQRVFATVLSAIQQFLKVEQPWKFIFSASKEVEPGQNAQSRASLYNRLMQRYASAWGYDIYHEDHGDQITYELTKKKSVEENFADGKKPGRKGLAKRMGVNCKQSVSKLRKIAKNSSGERARMAHWCANMKAGKKK